MDGNSGRVRLPHELSLAQSPGQWRKETITVGEGRFTIRPALDAEAIFFHQSKLFAEPAERTAAHVKKSYHEVEARSLWSLPNRYMIEVRLGR